MGCCASTPVTQEGHQPRETQLALAKLHCPVWQASEGDKWTAESLQAKRAEFWETQPYYGGSKEIWTALKAACSAEDMETTKLILEAAGVIVSKSDLSVCYDERGFKYDLPLYVLSAPTNLAA